MAYDQKKDKCLAEKVVFENNVNRITVGVYQYNGGDPKLQLSRQLIDDEKGSFKFAKLGRLHPEEAKEVVKGMQELLKELPNLLSKNGPSGGRRRRAS